MSVATASQNAQIEPSRLTSMDAYRGFVMICLAANGFGFKRVSENLPASAVWQAIGYQFDHVAWVGCAFWDLIQPSFMFLVGVALPYSYARREASGESRASLLRHVLIRSVVLILLGIFLSSTGQRTTNFTFMNVLTQIGLGYTFLYLLRNRLFVIQISVAVAVLAGYWAWFALTPAVSIENPKDYNLPESWVMLEGFDAHWQKNANPAATFDRWLLNLFPSMLSALPQKGVRPLATEDKSNTKHDREGVRPRFEAKPLVAPAEPPSIEENPFDASPTVENDPNADADPDNPEKKTRGILERCLDRLRRLVTRPEPYVFNAGGYQTLNFIPSFVTMLFGLMTGEFIRRAAFSRGKTFLTLLIAGLILLGLGYGWQTLGGCPLVKRIWTPSWTLFSTGCSLLLLSSFYGIIDGLGWKAWSFPLVVAGMNSMVLYLLGQLLKGWTSDLLKRHINEDLFNVFGDAYAPMVEANLVLLCFWLFVYWLYRQRIFVRI